ncbi:MAG: radical SAM protein [Candidatus Aenigmarchaeota archaeon]|nr:radical SAM protein [Candidatus Aenigmarchaeota archaeon]
MNDQAYIELTNHCNQDCIFCVRPKENKSSLCMDEAKKATEKLRDNRTIVFTGGEPTIWTGLPEIIRYAKKLGFEFVYIQTNGVRLSDKAYLKELKTAGLDMANVALHSNMKEISDKLTQSPGSFDKTIAGIKNVMDQDIKISIEHVITSENYKHLLDFVKFTQSTFTRKPQISFSFVRPDASALKNSGIVPKYSEVEQYLYSAMEYCTKQKIPFLIEYVPLCYLKGFESHSVELTRGELQDSFKTYWLVTRKVREEDQKYIDHLQAKGKQCSFCWLNPVCHGVRSNYAVLYGTSELYPVYKRLEEIL